MWPSDRAPSNNLLESQKRLWDPIVAGLWDLHFNAAIRRPCGIQSIDADRPLTVEEPRGPRHIGRAACGLRRVDFRVDTSKFACFEILLAFLGRNLRPEELHDLVDNELPRSLPVVEIAAVGARDIPVASDDIPETEEDRRGRSRVAALTHGHLSSIGLPELREVRRTGTFAVIETGSPGDQGRVALTIGHS